MSEIVRADGLAKGVLPGGIPTVIDIAFDPGANRAHCTIHADGALSPALWRQTREMCRNILGLHLDAGDFRLAVAKDPFLGPLAASLPGVRVVQSATVFEALTWAIMGQQINVAFAVSLRRTFIQQAGRRHSGGLLCYPAPEDAAKISTEALTARQFSRTKAETLLRLANRIAEGKLDLVLSETNTIERIRDALLGIKGIGPWTVNYGLLRGYAHADCSLHGDVAIRTAIHRLVGGDERPGIAAAEEFLKRYRPHRTMAAAFLWASLKPERPASPTSA